MKIIELLKLKNFIEGPLLSFAGVLIVILVAVGLIFFDFAWTEAAPLIGIATGLLFGNEKDFKKKNQNP